MRPINYATVGFWDHCAGKRPPGVDDIDVELDTLPAPLRREFDARCTDAAFEAFDNMDARASEFLLAQPLELRDELARLAARLALGCGMGVDDRVETLLLPVRDAFAQKFAAEHYTEAAFELAVEEFHEWQERRPGDAE